MTKPKNYSDKVARPAYRRPDECPMCEDTSCFIRFSMEENENGEEFIVWRCSSCNSPYAIPIIYVSQKWERYKNKIYALAGAVGFMIFLIILCI